MARVNAASPLSGLQPVALRHNTSADLLSQGALSKPCPTKSFFKSSEWGSFSKSLSRLQFQGKIIGGFTTYIRETDSCAFGNYAMFLFL